MARDSARCFVLDVQMTGAAFADGADSHELASILRRTAERIEQGGWRGYDSKAPAWIMESNGNTCGTWRIITRRDRS